MSEYNDYDDEACDDEACDYCGGTGVSDCTLDYWDTQHPEGCPACGGSNQITCPACRGTGKER